MDSKISKDSWDVFMFGIPLLALLVFGFFRLDQVFTARKNSTPSEAPPLSPRERHERLMRSDPDGRPWDDE